MRQGSFGLGYFAAGNVRRRLAATSTSTTAFSDNFDPFTTSIVAIFYKAFETHRFRLQNFREVLYLNAPVYILALYQLCSAWISPARSQPALVPWCPGFIPKCPALRRNARLCGLNHRLQDEPTCYSSFLDRGAGLSGSCCL